MEESSFGLRHLCQKCTGDCQIPWDISSSLPNTSMDMSKYRLAWNQQEMSYCLHSRRSPWWGYSPSPHRAEQLWDQCSSTSPKLSSAPPAPGCLGQLSQLPRFPLLLFLFSFHSSFSRSSMSLCIIYHACVSRGKKDPLQPSSPVTDGPSPFAAS